MRVLAISGSLRPASTNSSLVRAAALVAPDGVTVTVYEDLGALPHFNPDLDREGDTPPPTVASLRERVAQADALLVSCPEYAHGVPGSFKNALDWLVSGPEMVGMPIALVNPSLGSTHAHAALVEILTTMSARVVPEASLRIPLLDKTLDAPRIAADPMLGGRLRAALEALAAAAAAGA